MMAEIKTKEQFDDFFFKHYKEVEYENIQNEFHNFIVENEIFETDYLSDGCICKKDYKEHFNQSASFAFQDMFTQIFYEINPEIYETAFELFELNNGRKTEITETFDKRYSELYSNLLDQFFDQEIILKYQL